VARRRSAAGLPCQPRRLKLQAAGFVQPAPLLAAVRLMPMRYLERAGRVVARQGDATGRASWSLANRIWRNHITTIEWGLEGFPMKHTPQIVLFSAMI
jgi:hypothetical protein